MINKIADMLEDDKKFIGLVCKAGEVIGVILGLLIIREVLQ